MSSKRGQPIVSHRPLSSSGADGLNLDPQQFNSVQSSDTRLLRKIDIRLLPVIMAFYLLAFLDRINISNALTLGLQKDLGIPSSSNKVNIALAVFYVPYIIFEIPSNLLMKKLSPSIWLPGCMLCFGVIMLCHGFVTSYDGLVTARVFLGVAESGILPGCSYLLSMWYQPHEALRRFSIFFNSVTLAGAFGSLLASAISKMDGIRGYAGWRWIFIIEGAATVAIALICFLITPNFPGNAKWLSPAERDYMAARAAEAKTFEGNESLKTGAIRYFSDYKSHLAAVLYLGANIVGYSVSYFLPTIIKGFHYSPTETQLHAVPPFAAAWGFSILLCFTAAKVRHSLGFILFSWALCISGAAILLNVHKDVRVMYAAVHLITVGLFGGLPIAVMWYVMSLHGHVQRALGTAWMIGFGNIGGIIATWTFQSKDAPYYHLGYSLILFGVVLAATCAIGFGVGRWVECRRSGVAPRIRGTL